MNSIPQNFSNATGNNSFQLSYQRPVEPVDALPIKNSQPEKNLNSQIYIKTTSTNRALVSAELAVRNINNATALVQSVEETAALIESKFIDMKALAVQDGGCACQAMREAQESIRDISNSFSWNGENLMEGGGENNQETTLRNFTVATGEDTKDNLQLSFKSFNPMSAVDTDGSLEPVSPNLPDLNRSSGTDTHAYGDAALYSKTNEDAYLHTHTNAMREQAVLQIGRAIEGIQNERERLGGYLEQLRNISGKDQNELLKRNKYISQDLNIGKANHLAKSLKNEILRIPNDVRLALLNINPSTFNGLLN